jgi:hypothetical protein
MSMPRVRSEPMIPGLEREKTVHALDCGATVIGTTAPLLSKLNYEISSSHCDVDRYFVARHFKILFATQVGNQNCYTGDLTGLKNYISPRLNTPAMSQTRRHASLFTQDIFNFPPFHHLTMWYNTWTTEVNRQFLIAKGQNEYQAIARGICGGKSSTREDFLQGISTFPCKSCHAIKNCDGVQIQIHKSWPWH